MDIIKTIRRARSRNKDKQPRSRNQIVSRRVYLPYIQGVTKKLATVLKKHIEMSFKPLSTIRQRMRSMKDSPDHLQQVFYKVICSCGNYYIGEI